jgi:hypothetical protein
VFDLFACSVSKGVSRHCSLGCILNPFSTFSLGSGLTERKKERKKEKERKKALSV